MYNIIRKIHNLYVLFSSNFQSLQVSNLKIDNSINTCSLFIKINVISSTWKFPLDSFTTCKSKTKTVPHSVNGQININHWHSVNEHNCTWGGTLKNTNASIPERDAKIPIARLEYFARPENDNQIRVNIFRVKIQLENRTRYLPGLWM